ncbi:MAG: UbiA family prenyltransferase [Xanthobacteraceae bacterium]
MSVVELSHSSRQELLRPLVVDLDGTLVRSDLLIETFFCQLGQHPESLGRILRALRRGKAAFKGFLGEQCDIDPSTLPYDQEVLAYIKQASLQGRSIYLASASTAAVVQSISDFIGLFTGWFASDRTTNLKGDAKARRLVEEFGRRGFDYIGNDAADIPVWLAAETAIGVSVSGSVERYVRRHRTFELLHRPGTTVEAWTKLLRVHQYVKNTLVFVPVLTSHRLNFASGLEATAATVAFSLCASSGYILNDLIDLRADRSDPVKRNRPLASGAVPIRTAVIILPCIFGLAMMLGSLISVHFLEVLLGYFLLSMAYSLFLKRKMLVDVVVLGILYTIRVVAGAVAINVPMSEWLLAFSMFFFMSLALIKRYSDLAARADAGRPDPSNRNYRVGDLEIVGALAAAAGFNAVTVFSFYVTSPATRDLYSRPAVLWLACPILIYWISRALLLAHRRVMQEDPVVFALKDRISRLAIILLIGIVLIAI